MFEHQHTHEGEAPSDAPRILPYNYAPQQRHAVPLTKMDSPE